MNTKIDFVLPWVDGNNPEWKQRFQEYSGLKGDNSQIRFRDWRLLRYWFRSVEKFTPWVNNIYFITSGEYPEWLNLQHPKIKWIKHQDYIPEKYLPTFSANTIELNLHRIESLSETFVYFNDDLFVTRPLSHTRFFDKNRPCDQAILTAKPAAGGIVHIAINNIDAINRNFGKHTVLKKNFCKWFNLKYKKGLINNILLYPWIDFSGFIDPHISQPFLKSTFEKVWDAEPNLLNQTCLSKMRTSDDVNQWLIRYWQLAEGNFHPKNIQSKILCTDINDETYKSICDDIRQQKYEIICINDTFDISDFELYRKEIEKSFEAILPNKSSFEI